jgi:hypothetical protein
MSWLEISDIYSTSNVLTDDSSMCSAAAVCGRNAFSSPLAEDPENERLAAGRMREARVAAERDQQGRESMVPSDIARNVRYALQSGIAGPLRTDEEGD